jgi:hypothetical protein
MATSKAAKPILAARNASVVMMAKRKGVNNHLPAYAKGRLELSRI